MGYWIETKDADPKAFDIFTRHYSFRNYKKGRRDKRFVGPGERIVLVTPDYKALFVWKKFRSMDGQVGISCSVFRNESNIRASDLIIEAEEWAETKWPGERLYTYVAPGKVKSVNPGYCFKMAGWKACGTNKSGKLLLFEKGGNIENKVTE